MATTSVRSRPSSKAITTPSDRVDRLIIEAGKYLGADVGDEIPVGEVREQAIANGYGNDPHDDAIDSLLAEAGLIGETSVEVPPQGDLFGDLWRVGPDESLAGPEIDGVQDEPTAVERFAEWLEQKADTDGDTARHASHSYTFRGARKKYARAKDVDRWFSQNHETFSTVFITLCAERQPDETIASHAERFYPQEVTRRRYYELDKLGVTDEFAGVRLLSPKPLPEERQPRPNSSTSDVTTHAHTFLWVPGEVWPADLRGVVEKHVETVEGATEDLNPLKGAVSVRTHNSQHIRMSDGRREDRASTTALPGELGDNLPLLRTEYDGEGLPEWAMEWAANLRLGADDSLDSRGIKRWRPLGEFNNCADEYREIREGDD